ncbi:protein adenylyltransferase SelO [Alkalihalobacillus sp. 1P02AB]|uniref:protein adenylyltransferase SelO n=1 Tax=Alkalihalobacillus sp. 1P02AB TaxID=3132260 RepID=UPI0039A67A3F
MSAHNHEKMGWNLDNSYSRLPHAYYSNQSLNHVREPRLVILNKGLAQDLGLNEAILAEEGINILAGNRAPDGANPLAQAYAGHQFGNFTMLGDGRAVLFGEQITPKGERLDIQLKGSGRTVFSRGGDGRAALGPMLREYIMSEAMFGLGIPTTRSLAVVTTGEPVYRETTLDGAVLTRVAASHIRVGTFQYAAQMGEFDNLKALADYTIQRHYPKVAETKNPYLSLLENVIDRQVELIAKWQFVGFIHGVMNTDNMSISGETIDYGPCAFMDTYDPATVFSSIDQQGRYAYGNQPYIAAWNLARFAETLIPLLSEDKEQGLELAQQAIESFGPLYEQAYLAGMCKKLGLFKKEEKDEELVKKLLRLMEQHKVDYTNTFRDLTIEQYEQIDFYQSAEFKEWHLQWQVRLDNQKESKQEAKQLMKSSNQAIIPRNHRVEEALEAAVVDEDFSVMEKLLEVLANPFAYSDKQNEFTKLPESDEGYQTYCGT